MTLDLESLPVRNRTSDLWVRAALADPIALLADQVFLEKKAAANALELCTRWPEPEMPTDWATTLAGIARDETQHLHAVLKLLRDRGGELPRTHRNPYASELRQHVRLGEGNLELADRLLVSALIEVRSCERFDALARRCTDEELSRFWSGLEASERGHFVSFLKLAEFAVSPSGVRLRWSELLDVEARVLADQPPGARIHSGETRGV